MGNIMFHDIVEIMSYTTIFYGASIFILFISAEFKYTYYSLLNNLENMSFRNINVVYFNLNKYEENIDLEILFKKAFVCPKTNKILNYPIVNENGISYDFIETSKNNNVVKEDYFNRNLSNMISFLLKNKEELIKYKNKDLYDKLSGYF